MVFSIFLIPSLLAGTYHDLKHDRNIPLRFCQDFIITSVFLWFLTAFYNPYHAPLLLLNGVVTLIMTYALNRHGDIGEADIYYLTGIALVLRLYHVFLFLIAGCMVFEAVRRSVTKSKFTPFLPYISLSFVISFIVQGYYGYF